MSILQLAVELGLYLAAVAGTSFVAIQALEGVKNRRQCGPDDTGEVTLTVVYSALCLSCTIAGLCFGGCAIGAATDLLSAV